MSTYDTEEERYYRESQPSVLPPYGVEQQHESPPDKREVKDKIRRMAITTALLFALGGGGYAKGPEIIDSFISFVTRHLSVETGRPEIKDTSPVNNSQPPATPITEENIPVTKTTVITPPDVEETPTQTVQEYTKIPLTIDTTLYVDEFDNPIGFQKDGFPLVPFNQEKVRAMKKDAIATGEPHLIAILPLYDKLPFTPSPDRPIVTEKPKDIVSAEILAEHGIRIIPTDNVKLFIRENAFEPGGYFDGFSKSGRKLDIILVRESAVVGSALTDPIFDTDPTLKRAKYRLKETDEMVDEYRRWCRDQFLSKIEELRKEASNFEAQGKTEEAKKSRDNILYEKIKLLELHNMSNPEVAAYYDSATNEGKSLAGRYIYGPDVSTIYLAVGGDHNPSKYLTFYFDGTGQFQHGQVSSFMFPDISANPEARHGFPRPDDYSEIPGSLSYDPDNYRYQSNQESGIIPFALHHELAHEKLIGQNIGTDKEDHSEYNTDTKAMEVIGKAYQAWIDSNYTNTLGYPFVFYNVEEGVYVISQTEPTPPQPSPTSPI